MPVRRMLKIGKVQLSYLEWHQGTEPLILLHGLADHALVWLSLGEYLAADYHIIAPDLPGHGESSKLETGYCSSEIIADLEALIKHLGWHNFHVLGHSWSGKLAAIWATKNPNRFRSLILVDPFFISKLPSWLKFTFPILYRVLPFLKGMGPFVSYQEAEKVAQKLKQYRGWSPLQQEVFQNSIEQKSDGTWGSKFTVAARNQIFEDVMAIAGLTKSLDIPTLLIKPEQGLNRTQWQLNPYQIYLSNLEIQTIPGNHWAFLVEPDTFNQTVATFLSKVTKKT
jgi:pimeloyl-ACP methyl ester carboxylesterase